MQCLKCGRETQDSRVFCEECLAQMEKHPVKPGTPVSIYKRTSKPVNNPVKKQKKAEEILPKLQKENHRLLVSVIVLAILLVLAMSGLAFKLYQDFDRLPLGQNYNTITPMPIGTASTDPVSTTAPAASTAANAAAATNATTPPTNP